MSLRTVSPISTTFSNDVGNDYDFSGSAITGTGIMIKNGTGTATFANPLTFTGGTYINAGRIQLTDQTLSSDSITIESGAFLTYDNASAVTQGPTSIRRAIFVRRRHPREEGNRHPDRRKRLRHDELEPQRRSVDRCPGRKLSFAAE